MPFFYVEINKFREFEGIYVKVWKDILE